MGRQGTSVTQIGHEQRPAGAAASWSASPVPRPGRAIRVVPGTLMEKLIPVNLVDPYLAGQRWVIAGFAYRVADAAAARPRAPELWVLRWRALDMQTYLEVSPAGLFIEPGPIPVGTEMYRITPAGEEFVARHDGQAWLRPAGG
jgi:hypothetical protein